MHSVRRAVAFAALVALSLGTACQRRGVDSGLAPTTRDDEFPQGIFIYDLVAVRQHLRGTVTIRDTLVTLAPVDDRCTRVEQRGSLRVSQVVTFLCTGLQAQGMQKEEPSTRIQIHLRYPTTQSRWSRVARIDLVSIYADNPRMRRCLRWVQNRLGERLCVEYEEPAPHEARPVPHWESGILNLMPATRLLPDTGAARRPRPPSTR